MKEEGESWAEDLASLMKVLSSGSEGTIPQDPSCPGLQEETAPSPVDQKHPQMGREPALDSIHHGQTPLLNSRLGNKVVSREPLVSLVMELPGLLSVVLKTVWQSHKKLLEPSSSAQPLTRIQLRE